MSPDDFAIVGVNCDISKNWIPKKLTENGTVTWRNFQVESIQPPFSSEWGIKHVADSFLIDQKGVIRGMNIEYEKMEEAIVSLIAEGHSN